MSLFRPLGDAPLRLLIFAIFLAGCATSVEAQGPPKSQILPPRTIVLPQKMRAGDPATLGVLDSTGRMTPGANVELSTGQKVTTDATGRALFVAPSEPGVMTAKIVGQETSALSTVVASSNSKEVSPEPQTDDSVATQLNQSHEMLSYPRFLTLHDQFTIEGTEFNGRADANHVSLAGQPCLVAAASPVALVVLPGLHIPIGPVNLQVRANGVDLGPLPVTTVLLEISGPAEALTVGSQAKLILHARGTTERLGVEVRNTSPEIIQFVHGNVQRLRTSGGDQNIAQVDMKLLAAGNYAVTAKLIPTDSGMPDMQAIRDKLLDARRAASGTWTVRVDRIIARLDQSPQDLAQIRADLKHLLDDKPDGQLATLLDSAWRELNP
jgi:hypothetical protein